MNSHWVPGNRITLLQNGEAFCRASLAAPQPARHLWLQRWRHLRTREDAVDVHASAPIAATAGARAAVVTRDNGSQRTDIERHYRAAVRRGRQRVLIANAYFFPGYRLLRDRRHAARRGVQVDLVLQGRPDMVWVQRTSELLYAYRMRAGVCSCRPQGRCARPGSHCAAWWSTTPCATSRAGCGTRRAHRRMSWRCGPSRNALDRASGPMRRASQHSLIHVTAAMPFRKKMFQR